MTDSFFEIHRGLPREGPGDDECTLRALEMLRPLPREPRILDLGCGPGAQTLCLARATGGTVTAVDLHRPFLEDLQARAGEAGLRDRIRPLEADMGDLDLPPASFDLLWAEGSAYSIGVENALVRWRPLLVPGGGLAFSELTWLSEERPEDLCRFWDEHYPEMTDVAGNLNLVADAGYLPLGHFVLPDRAWWRGYYDPLEARIQRLRAERPEAAAVLDAEEAEIHLFRRFSSHYGYVFYVARTA